MAERVAIQTQGYTPTLAEQRAWVRLAQAHRLDAFGSHDELSQSQQIPQFVLEQARMFDAIIADRHRRWASREVYPQERIEGKSTMQYDGEFDIENYQRAFSIGNEEERERTLAELDDYTRKQLVTHLGERVNVLLSTIDYSITSEGQLFVPQLGKTAEQMVIDGRDHQVSLPDVREIDKPRMDAEIEEMCQIEVILCNPNTPVGSMITVISAPGGEELFVRQMPNGEEQGLRDSLFLHNFYDVFRLEEREVNGRTERFVRLYRYSSSLTYEEYLHKAIQLKRDYFASPEAGHTSLDAYFLSHIITLTQSDLEEPEDVHKFFHRDHAYMTRQDFEEVIMPGTSELIDRYIAVMHKLAMLPAAAIRSEQAHTFNVLLIEAENLREQLETMQKNISQVDSTTDLRHQLVVHAQTIITSYSLQDIFRLGKQENVKQGGGACPGEGGMRTDRSLISLSFVPQIAQNTSPFSVSSVAFDSDEYGSLHFTCTKGHPNTRPAHIKIPACTTCGEKFTDDCS